MNTRKVVLFSKDEAKERFEAALRGSRNVGPQQMKDIPKKPNVPKSKSKRAKR